MKSVIALSILLFAALSKNSVSQVVWNADCTNLDPPFTVLFSKTMATATLKGWSYELTFSSYLVDEKGDHWSIYTNDQLQIATNYHLNNDVAIGRVNKDKDPKNTLLITKGSCKR